MRLPKPVAAVIEALRFSGRSLAALETLRDAEWREVLIFCDRAQLTLVLALTPPPGPDWVRRRLAQNLANNTVRRARLREVFSEIAAALDAHGIKPIVLKGFANEKSYAPDPRARVQYDIDLFCPETAAAARDALREIGYESLGGTGHLPTDHLPPLVRKTGWEWRGDFFDPEIPFPVDLHFRLWDDATECLPASGLEAFPQRQVWEEWEGLRFRALCPADALGYASLHLLRHLLRGDARPYHVYEVAWFLHHHAEAHTFWDEWSSLHSESLRRLEAISFRLAEAWFGCGLHPVARREAEKLPAAVALWFEHYAYSGLESWSRPNKDELWLHLALVESGRERRRILRRRLLPTTLPGPVDSVYVPETRMTPWRKARKRLRYALYLAARGWHHARAFAPLLYHGFTWWRRRRGLSRRPRRIDSQLLR